MGSSSKSIAPLKAYGRAEGQMEEADELIRELKGQSDRAAAIVMVASVEADLHDCIRSRLRMDLTKAELAGLFDGEAPLATFSAKIKIGHALGLYGPKTRDDLDVIRHLRNTCAHAKRPVSFDLPVFASVLTRLNVIQNHTETQMEGGNTPRNRFSRACVMLSVRLMRLRAGELKPWEAARLLP